MTTATGRLSATCLNGHAVRDGALFCPRCGAARRAGEGERDPAPLSAEMPSEPSALSATEDLVCALCGSSTVLGDRFCQGCGAEFEHDDDAPLAHRERFSASWWLKLLAVVTFALIALSFLDHGSPIPALVIGAFAFLAWRKPRLAGGLLAAFSPIGALLGAFAGAFSGEVALGAVLLGALPLGLGVLLLLAARKRGTANTSLPSPLARGGDERQQIRGERSRLHEMLLRPRSQRDWLNLAGLAILICGIAYWGLHSALGNGANTPGPIKKCISLWNGPGNSRARLDLVIYATDLAGTPAALVQTKQDGRCQVLFGAVGSSYLFYAYVYDPADMTYTENKAVERRHHAALTNHPQWNARPNDDGTLTAGSP